MGASATAFGKRQEHGTVDRLLLAASVLSSVTYLFTQSLQPFPGSVAIKALAVSPLALLVFRLLGGSDGLILGISLLFSSAGDVFLDLDGERFFIFGLGSFLIAHLLYVALFVRSWPRPVAATARQKLLVSILVIYSLALTAWLWPGLGDLALPVVAYMCAITSMGIAAALAGFREPWVVLGALMFIASDSLIGVTKFRTAVIFRDYLVWATYYAGQCAIALGFLREKTQIRLSLRRRQ